MGASTPQEIFPDIVVQFEADPAIAKLPLAKRIPECLFGRYQAKVRYDMRETGVFGYGSMQFARDVRAFGDLKEGMAVTVGSMSENSMGGAILLGGEHPNDRVMNHTLSVFPEIRLAAQEAYPNRKFHFSRGPVVIGSNVVVSENCTILSGVTIGDGAVIGAGTVVTKDVPPYAIAVGKGDVLRMRFKEKEIEALLKLKWWDFTPDKILEHFALIEKLPDPAAMETLMALAPSCYRKPSRNCILFSIAVRGDGTRPMACVGAEIDGVAHATDSLPRAFQFYVRQIHNPPGTKTYLVKDIFAFCGLGAENRQLVTNP